MAVKDVVQQAKNSRLGRVISNLVSDARQGAITRNQQLGTNFSNWQANNRASVSPGGNLDTRFRNSSTAQTVADSMLGFGAGNIRGQLGGTGAEKFLPKSYADAASYRAQTPIGKFSEGAGTLSGYVWGVPGKIAGGPSLLPKLLTMTKNAVIGGAFGGVSTAISDILAGKRPTVDSSLEGARQGAGSSWIFPATSRITDIALGTASKFVPQLAGLTDDALKVGNDVIKQGSRSQILRQLPKQILKGSLREASETPLETAFFATKDTADKGGTYAENYKNRFVGDLLSNAAIGGARQGVGLTPAMVRAGMNEFDAAAEKTAAQMGLTKKQYLQRGAIGGGEKAIDPLTAEAQKYGSAEEFVKGQTFFRGEGGSRGGGNYFTNSEEFAQEFAGIKPLTEVGIEKVYTPKELPFAGNEKEITSAIADAKSKGYKAVTVSEGSPFGEPIESVFVFDKSAIKTKSQLTDIYNQATPAKSLDEVLQTAKSTLNPNPLTAEAQKYGSVEEFVKNVDDERITFSLPGSKAKAVVTESTPRYELIDDLTEAEFKRLGVDEDDLITKFEHIEVDPSFRGKGVGTNLMNRAIKEAKNSGREYSYLNASPMGSDGLRLNDLTKFYEKFGFKTVKSQGNNNLMFAKTKDLKLTDIYNQATQTGIETPQKLQVQAEKRQPLNMGQVDPSLRALQPGKTEAQQVPQSQVLNPRQSLEMPQAQNGKTTDSLTQGNIASDRIISEARKEIGTTAEKKAPTIRKIADDLYTQWVNRFAPVERASKFVKAKLKTQGAELRPENDPEYLVRRFTGAGGIANARFKNELKPIIDQLEELKIDKLDMDVYLKAKRDIGLAERNIYGSDSNQASARVVALMEKYPGIDGISQQLYKYQNDGFKEMIDVGFLSKESGDIIAQQNPDYVPFQRVMDDLDNYLGVPSNKLQQGTQPIQKIKGSKRQIESPIESVIANTFKQRAAIEKNRVAKSIVDLQKVVPEIGFEQVKKSTPETITVWRDGKKEFWKVGTDIADTVKATNEESINTLLKIFQAPAALLRQGATGRNPDFLIPNIIKDQFDAGIASKYGYIPFVDYVSGLKSMLSNDDIYKRWETSGAKIDLGELSGRKSIQQSFDQATKRKGLFSWLGTGLDALGTISEVPTRVGLFKRAYKKTGNELIAALESRDSTVDFARMGSKMKTANSIIPFLNVGIQGFDKIIRQARSNPGKLALNAGLYAGLPAITTTLYNLNNYPEEYAEIPQYVKNSNFVLVKGRNEDGTVDYFTLPKGNIAPLITNPLENFLAYAYGQNDQSFGEFATQFISSALPVVGDGSSVKEIATKTIGQNLPQLIKPAIESLMNRSFYKYDSKKEQSKEIVPTYLNKKEPYQRAYDWTPTSYKKIGAVLNVSPLSVQHLAESYLAGYTKLPNQIIGILEGIADGKEIRKNDIPILRRFVSTTFPTSAKKTVVKTQKETPLMQRMTGRVSSSKETNAPITEEIRDEIKERVKNSDTVSNTELGTAYLSKSLSMPKSNRYEKSQRDTELYSSLSTIEGNEYLTDQQKTVLKGKVASELGKTTQDLQIYSVAKGDTNSKTLYAYDQIDKSTSFDDTMRYLVNGRKPVNGKILVSDGVIDNLVADGVIPYALGKDIKDIDLNEDGTHKGKIKSRRGKRSGRGSKKNNAAQLKAFNDLGEDLKKIKIGTSKIRTTQSQRITTKGLTFSGR